MRIDPGARLYAIIDTGCLGGRDVEFYAAELASGGADVVQLRAKGMAPEAVAALGRRILPVLHAAAIPLIVNDHPGVACAIGADGVHVGQDDLSVSEARALAALAGGPPPIVGKSTHSPAQALAAVAEGADYIGFGPLFATPTKPDYTPIGIEDIRSVTERAGLPVFCIGGIKIENVGQVLAAGAARVVVVSGILQAPRPREYCRALKNALLDR